MRFNKTLRNISTELEMSLICRTTNSCSYSNS